MFSFLFRAVSSRIKTLCMLSFALLMGMAVLSGCFGGYAQYRVECEAEYPLNDYIYRKFAWGSPKDVQNMNPSGNPLNKDDFLKDFGKPDEIVTISPEKEMWVYKRHDLCGLIPLVFLPVPLLAPCDLFDHITFENDKAVYIHFKRTKIAGVGTIVGPVTDNIEKCPNEKAPLPKVPEILPPHGAGWIPNTENCRRIAHRDGAIWWTDGMVNIKIDMSSHEVLESIPVSDSKYAALDYARGFGSVWFATDSKKPSLLTRMDPETGNIVTTIPLAEKAGTIMTGADSVWVIHNKMVSRINPQTNQVAATITVDYLSAKYGKIAVGSNAVWISPGIISPKMFRIDPVTNRVVNSFKVDLDTKLHPAVIDMAATKDALWVLAYIEKKKESSEAYKGLVLAEYDAMTNVLRSTQHLVSGSSSNIFQSSIVASENDVWVCISNGIYFIPKDAVR